LGFAVLLPEFEVSSYSDVENLAAGFGLSVTFRRAVVRVDAGAVADVARRLVGRVWGALLLWSDHCVDDIPCVSDLAEAVRVSEVRGVPVVYRGPAPSLARVRVSTFNRGFGRARRFVAASRRRVGVGDWALPALACLFRLVRWRLDVPVVVADAGYVVETGVGGYVDYMVAPTHHVPGDVPDVVDVSVEGLPAYGIQLGILMGGYSAGPVYSLNESRPRLLGEVLDRGGLLLVRGGSGDPCLVDRVGYVEYAESRGVRYVVDEGVCDSCGDCLLVKCPAVLGGRIPRIADSCTGCAACAYVCTRGAIRALSPDLG